MSIAVVSTALPVGRPPAGSRYPTPSEYRRLAEVLRGERALTGIAGFTVKVSWPRTAYGRTLYVGRWAAGYALPLEQLTGGERLDSLFPRVELVRRYSTDLTDEMLHWMTRALWSHFLRELVRAALREHETRAKAASETRR